MERGFRSLKPRMEMRPIWHHPIRRVEAHIFVAALVFLIERALRDARVDLSAQSALQSLKTIRHVQFRSTVNSAKGRHPALPDHGKS